MAHSNPITIGMLAHVDAGKTTLSEAILYSAGSIRKLGRVDNQDTFLDTGDMERARGITIFSKQAAYNYNGSSYTLLDTPGHVDFSAETERTLWVLDAAVLVISGMDGVQGHTETLWSLLKRLGIPVFIFVNKMDQQGTNRARIMEQLKNRLSESCVDFNNIDYEEVAMCHEEALEQFLESAHVDDALMSRMIMERKMVPVYFGSALRMNGVEELINGIDTYVSCPDYGEEFSAKVYKITRDDRGERLTHLKVCGGSLKSKMLIGNEKVNQIRVYAGDKFTSINEVSAGTVCAVTGLSETKAGQFIGAGGEDNIPVLEPVLNYKLNPPTGADPVALLSKLRTLEEEEPELHVEWDENFKEIHVSVMGPVLIEVLTNIIKTRFGVDVTFGEGSIVYKETIKNKAYGIGHFEPLRHYAEVHLLLEPGEPGSGMRYECHCSEDILDKNWQRLVYTHLCEKMHRGVLTGSELTDMKINGPAPDVLTFAGNGEPTLHPDFPAIMDDVVRLRNEFFPAAKISVLSNATLAPKPEIRAALMKADNNLQKLDTVNSRYIEMVNRPTGKYDVNEIIESLKLFNGHVIIQTMFMKGADGEENVDNTGDEYVMPWLEAVKSIKPQEVMIYTIDRETPDTKLRKATHEELDRIVALIKDAGIPATASY